MAVFVSQASALTRTTTTNNAPSYVTKLSHNVAVTNAKTYALFWFCVVDSEVINNVFIARFRNTTDGVDLSIFFDGHSPVTQRHSFGGAALFLADASETITFEIQFASLDTSTAVGCQQARIIVFELESGVDFWNSSNSPSSRATGTYSSKVALAVSPGSTKDFLICFSYTSNLELQSKVNDGTSDIYLHDRHNYWGAPTTTRRPSFWFTKRTIASSTTFDLLAASATGTSQIDHAWIVALDLSEFAGNLFGSSLTQGDSTSATYASRATVTGNVNGGNHLVLGSAIQFGNATAADLSNHKLRAAGTDLGVPLQHKIDTTTYKTSQCMMSVESLTAGSRTIDWQWARASGAATHSILSNVVAAVELAAAVSEPFYTQTKFQIFNDNGTGLAPPP